MLSKLTSNKKTLLLAFIILLIIAPLVVILFTSSSDMHFLKMLANSNEAGDFTLNLDNTETIHFEGSPDDGGYYPFAWEHYKNDYSRYNSSFNYTGVKPLDTGLCSVKNGSTMIKSDQNTSNYLKNITINYTGGGLDSVLLETSFSAPSESGVFTDSYHYYLASNTSTNIVGNYFKFTFYGSLNIQSIVINYSCNTPTPASTGATGISKDGMREFILENHSSQNKVFFSMQGYYIDDTNDNPLLKNQVRFVGESQSFFVPCNDLEVDVTNKSFKARFDLTELFYTCGAEDNEFYGHLYFKAPNQDNYLPFDGVNGNIDGTPVDPQGGTVDSNYVKYQLSYTTGESWTTAYVPLFNLSTTLAISIDNTQSDVVQVIKENDAIYYQLKASINHNISSENIKGLLTIRNGSDPKIFPTSVEYQEENNFTAKFDISNLDCDEYNLGNESYKKLHSVSDYWYAVYFTTTPYNGTDGVIYDSKLTETITGNGTYSFETHKYSSDSRVVIRVNKINDIIRFDHMGSKNDSYVELNPEICAGGGDFAPRFIQQDDRFYFVMVGWVNKNGDGDTSCIPTQKDLDNFQLDFINPETSELIYTANGAKLITIDNNSNSPYSALTDPYGGYRVFVAFDLTETSGQYNETLKEFEMDIKLKFLGIPVTINGTTDRVTFTANSTNIKTGYNWIYYEWHYDTQRFTVDYAWN